MAGTGIVRDDLFLEHDPGAWHPESPERLRVIYGLLEARSWPVTVLPRRPAVKKEITLIHRPEYYELVARTDGKPHGFFDADTSTSARSFQAALAAAGGLIALTGKVMDGELANGFALVRPPGHHAEADRAMGFCLFNNVAIAAAWAIQNKGLSRVMIMDWDLHHGNGTQHSFYTDPRVLYISTHQYPHYPGTGALGETGRGPGLGYTINIPLSWGHGDEEYVAIFQKIVAPVARAFRPELILVSAGFDINHRDPLGDMKVTREGFAGMARVLKDVAQEVCGGRLVFTLEGGYHLEGQANGVAKVLDVLTDTDAAGEALARREQPEPEIVGQVRHIQASYWRI
ncbi:MAG: histone deacetylase [Thermodesulfobacteriota bacterium]